MSVVRMHHQVFALKDDLHQRRQRPDAIQHDADSISDAYFDWAGRFPRDDWLPRIAWELATLYEELPGFEAQDQALTLLAFIDLHYPTTAIGRASTQDLVRGVGLRAWPRWAGREPAQHVVLAGQIQLRDPNDAQAVLQAVTEVEARLQSNRISFADAFGATSSLEGAFRSLSPGRSGEIERRCAWDLAALYELLPGEVSRDRALRMLALVLDRYGDSQYGVWSLRDLQRGVGVRSLNASS